MSIQIPDSDQENEVARERSRSRIGSGLLILGGAILTLLLVDNEGGLPWNMPRSWYINRSLWVGAGLAACGAGWYLLGTQRQDDEYAQPRPKPVRFKRVVLYTRRGCHLCEQATHVLAKYKSQLPPVEEVDIDRDPRLIERFTTCVPVVEIDGKIRFRGRVNEVLLRRLIEFAPADGQSA